MSRKKDITLEDIRNETNLKIGQDIVHEEKILRMTGKEEDCH